MMERHSRYNGVLKTASQPAAQQDASQMFDAAVREQERLRATLSPEELAEDHRRRVEELNQICEEASRYARANGLTEEILAEILAEK
jgi:hypothetical protein